jgi:hypothetical protein
MRRKHCVSLRWESRASAAGGIQASEAKVNATSAQRPSVRRAEPDLFGPPARAANRLAAATGSQFLPATAGIIRVCIAQKTDQKTGCRPVGTLKP